MSSFSNDKHKEILNLIIKEKSVAKILSHNFLLQLKGKITVNIVWNHFMIQTSFVISLSNKCFFNLGIYIDNKSSKINIKKYNKGNSSKYNPLNEKLFFFFL